MSAASVAGASHGLLETLGSAAGVKIATLAAVATAALGAAEVSTHRESARRDRRRLGPDDGGDGDGTRLSRRQDGGYGGRLERRGTAPSRPASGAGGRERPRRHGGGTAAASAPRVCAGASAPARRPRPARATPTVVKARVSRPPRRPVPSGRGGGEPPAKAADAHPHLLRAGGQLLRYRAGAWWRRPVVRRRERRGRRADGRRRGGRSSLRRGLRRAHTQRAVREPGGDRHVAEGIAVHVQREESGSWPA